ncbi:ABC transporter B family member 20-like [Oryza glaberrima]|uniref:ABC transporter B family member 20-like n=1 Tax=Oryza glaberrima TaxID=4538 RepID=UPI00224C54DC|nr:ABC transporter B family member 20-like [Oryza glaberrima]
MPESWRDAEANASAAAPPSSASVAAADSSLGNGKGGGGAAARGERAASAASASAWVPFHFHKLFAFADKTDVALGTLGAVANGIALPFMTVLFGNLIDAVNRVSMVSLEFIYLAIASSVASFVQVTCWMIPGERQAARIRNLCLKTILRQEIAFFVKYTNTGEVVGRMSGDTMLIQDAMAAATAARHPSSSPQPPPPRAASPSASASCPSTSSSRGSGLHQQPPRRRAPAGTASSSSTTSSRGARRTSRTTSPTRGSSSSAGNEPHPLPARPRKPRPSGPRIRLCLLCLAVVGGRLLIPHHRRVRFTRCRP